MPLRCRTDSHGCGLPACASDTSTWHTASPNYSDRDREAIIINYTGGPSGSSPDRSFPIPLELMEKAEEAGLVSPERRLILGMPASE